MAGGLDDRCKKVAKFMQLNWPLTPKDFVRASHLNKSHESRDWESLASRGPGVKDFWNTLFGIAGFTIR
jgi:hypothetical protein